MRDINALLDTLATSLQTALQVDGSELVTRNLHLDFSRLSATQRAQGVVSLFVIDGDQLGGERSLADVAGRLRLGLLYEFFQPLGTGTGDNNAVTGLDIERRELDWVRRTHTWAQAPGLGLCPLDPDTFETSTQALAHESQGQALMRLTFAELD